ncbi:CheR family methyltransferase [Ferrimonas balearica]|uniref:CheR family methyltransferase n=1 Tax=Ferrimonas balearica TaxID=44012 RepID=UPI001C99C76A|nr:protein-glutamate O-methyltransferase CheR [Ferrimonas balearica]MBY5992928.1 protein-glutamate O-methyltransferase CheR [Ferrimonas balearica]
MTLPTKSLAIEDYQAFADFLQRQCGIVLGDNKQYLVRSRLGPLMAAHHASMADLVREAMRPERSTLKTQVIEAMTTNETFWFRDTYPFELLQSEVLPDLARLGRRLKIWSAACSTGQEPYSLAMSLQEFRRKQPGRLLQGAEILATDLSSQVLAQAQAGEYDALAMARGLSEERKRQFFDCLGSGRMRIKPELRQSVSFRQQNLLESYLLLGRFDVIFCRNVLIYFSQESKQQILRQFAAALNPGGYLVLGASESIANLSSDFEMRRFPSGILYYRP